MRQDRHYICRGSAEGANGKFTTWAILNQWIQPTDAQYINIYEIRNVPKKRGKSPFIAYFTMGFPGVSTPLCQFSIRPVYISQWRIWLPTPPSLAFPHRLVTGYHSSNNFPVAEYSDFNILHWANHFTALLQDGKTPHHTPLNDRTYQVYTLDLTSLPHPPPGAISVKPLHRQRTYLTTGVTYV